jgi:hypothetical protein
VLVETDDIDFSTLRLAVEEFNKPAAETIVEEPQDDQRLSY